LLAFCTCCPQCRSPFWQRWTSVTAAGDDEAMAVCNQYLPTWLPLYRTVKASMCVASRSTCIEKRHD
jgi:hypothetical protein